MLFGEHFTKKAQLPDGLNLELEMKTGDSPNSISATDDEVLKVVKDLGI